VGSTFAIVTDTVAAIRILKQIRYASKYFLHPKGKHLLG
jgi:hypothetical protein